VVGADVVDMQRAGELPVDVVWKISVMMAPSNPVSARLLEQLGASTVNVPSDVTVAQLSELRAATSLPLVILYAFFVEHYVSAMTGAVKE